MKNDQHFSSRQQTPLTHLHVYTYQWFSLTVSGIEERFMPSLVMSDFLALTLPLLVLQLLHHQ